MIAAGAINLLNSFVSNKRCAVLISTTINKIYGNRLKKIIACPFFIYNGEKFNLSGFDLVIGIGGEAVMHAASECRTHYALVPTVPMGLVGFNPQFIVIDESIIACAPKNVLAAGVAKLMPQACEFAKNIYKKQNIKDICELMLTTPKTQSSLAYDMARILKSDIPMGRKILRCKEFLYGSNGYDNICNNIFPEPNIDKAQLVLAQHFALKRRLEFKIQKAVNN